MGVEVLENGGKKARISIEISTSLDSLLDELAADSRPSLANTLGDLLRKKQIDEMLDTQEPRVVVSDGREYFNEAAIKQQAAIEWLGALSDTISELEAVKNDLAGATEKLHAYRVVLGDIGAETSFIETGESEIDRNRRNLKKLLGRLFPSFSLGVVTVDLISLRKIVSIIYGRRKQ